MSIKEVTNPGLVNVADEGYDGLASNVPPFKSIPVMISPNNVDGDASSEKRLSVDQPVTVSPAMTAQRNVDGDASSEKPLSVDQPVTVHVPGEPLLTIQGGTFSPIHNPKDVIANNVVGQVFGNEFPKNVFV